MTARLYVCLASVLFALSAQTFAADAFLADRHQAKGLKCDACHTAAPAKGVTLETCLKCHGGTYQKLAASTRKGEVNFHETHMGDTPCSECHKGHKASSLVCNECHDLKVKVP